MPTTEPYFGEMIDQDQRFASNLASWAHLASEVRDRMTEMGYDEDYCNDVITSDTAQFFVELVAVALRTRSEREQRTILGYLDIPVGSGGSAMLEMVTRHQHGTWDVDAQTPSKAVCWTANCCECDHKLMVTVG
jgi:hypothetical protein